MVRIGKNVYYHEELGQDVGQLVMPGSGSYLVYKNESHQTGNHDPEELREMFINKGKRFVSKIWASSFLIFKNKSVAA